MNYLAHAFLVQKPKEIMIGNIFGDFVRGSDLSKYSALIQQGILLHRRIDQYTDSHIITKESRKLFGSKFRTVSGIMIDVFYDHFLAKNWSSYSDQTLEDFTRFVYHELIVIKDTLPARLLQILPYMIKGDWLSSYREIENVGHALAGLSRRLKRKNTLADGVEALLASYDQLELNFTRFFSDLQSFVKQEMD
ncbi:MAG: DUF479 domain-containing protein [Calditrichaeota bacterium]|nr:DUF479 domain-containing protein [Calditrichota bacterium]